MKTLKRTKSIQIILISLILLLVGGTIVILMSNNGIMATQVENCSECTSRSDGIY